MKLREKILHKSASLGGNIRPLCTIIMWHTCQNIIETALCLCVALLCNLVPIVIFPNCLDKP